MIYNMKLNNFGNASASEGDEAAYIAQTIKK